MPVVAAPAMEAGPPPRPPPTTIVLRVDTTPSDATVLVDGVRLGRSPLTVTLRRRERIGKLKLRKRGYVTRWVEIPLDADLSWTGLLHAR